MNTSIKLVDVHAGYVRNNPVLHGVTLEIPRSRFTVILGPNGAGKSTLLRVMAGLLKPMRGYAIVEGLRNPGSTHQEFARIAGYVPQVPQGKPLLTVIEYVAMSRVLARGGWRLKSSDINAAYNALQLLGVEHLAYHKLGELSGGQRRLVDIAQAIAKEPRVLLLDEPTSQLDFRNQVEVLNVLKTLSKRGVTVVAVLHDLNQAIEYADYIAVVAKGRLVAKGDPTSLDYNVLEEVYGVKLVKGSCIKPVSD